MSITPKLIFRYYITLDGVFGFVFLTIMLISLFIIIYSFIIHKKVNNFLIIALVIIFTIIFDELFGLYSGQKMLYSRMIKQYNPLFLITIGFLYVNYLKPWRIYFVSTICVFITFGYCKFYLDYHSLAYPRDIMSTCINSSSSGFDHDILSYDKNYPLLQYNEYAARIHFTIPPQSKNIRSIPDSALFLNFSFPSQVSEKWNQEFDHSQYKVIFSERHYISYIPYTFDCLDFETYKERRSKLRLEIYVQK